MSFENYLQAAGKSKSTVKHYNSYILDFLAWLDKDNTEAENAGAKEVLAYMSHLQNKGQENKTRNIRLNVVKQFFNWQIDRGLRTDNPVAHLKIRGSKTRKLYQILTLHELESLLESYTIPGADDPRSNRNWFSTYKLSKQRNKAILSLLINQGLTTAEIEKLNTTDLKLKEGQLYVSGSRKSNERTLELRSRQIIDLMEYQTGVRTTLLEYQQDKDIKKLFLPVPVAGEHTANQTLQIWKGFTKEIRALNSKFVNFRQIRTSVITRWLKDYNLRQVQYMAGHRFVSSTESYMVNQTEDLLKDIDDFHPF